MQESRNDQDAVAVALSADQRKYLLERLALPAALGDLIRGASSRAVTLTRAQAKQLMTAVSTRLQVAGFDVAYDPTAEGAMLESIIDRLTGAASP